jgi:hypothetical protein
LKNLRGHRSRPKSVLSSNVFTPNRTITIDAAYRDFAAVLKEMDAKAKDLLNKAYDPRIENQ